LIRITIDDDGLLDQLRELYANKFHTSSQWQRSKLNRLKRTFKEQVRLLAKVEGEPVEGLATLVVEISLPRIDIDAPLKTVLDAIAPLIFTEEDDRVIRSCHLVMRRPCKGTRKKKEVRRAVVVHAWPLEEYSASSGYANDVVCRFYDYTPADEALRTDSV
jgi:hypothetical protein